MNNNDVIFDYVALEGEVIQSNANNNNNNNALLNQWFPFDNDYIFDDIHETNQRSQDQLYRTYENIIIIKSFYAVARIFILYLLYYIDNFKLTPFLIQIIAYLLIHEALAISNCFSMKSFLFFKRLFNPNTREFPIICYYIEILTNFVFFSWLCYSIYMILSDPIGLERSLEKNLIMTYYLAVLILIGFFTFSQIIFYILFFICFFPCLIYVYCSDLHSEYLIRQRAKRVKEFLKGIPYSQYSKLNGVDETTCIICTADYKQNDLVIKLPCNIK